MSDIPVYEKRGFTVYSIRRMMRGRGVGTQQVGRGGWWNNKNILHNKEGRLISNNLE